MLFIFVIMSFAVAEFKLDTDFPAYYRAARIILDPSIPNTQIYEDSDPTNRYNIPEKYVPYRYSMAITYLLAPFGLLPYTTSKTIFGVLNILVYLLSIGIILRRYKVAEKYLFRYLALSFLWLPFMWNFSSVQINVFMLLLITLAVFSAKDNRPTWCGILIGFAALIKFFPIAIAAVLSLKNWRIFAVSAVTFGLALLFPGTKEWFASFSYPLHNVECYSAIYKVFGERIFYAYAFIIAESTAIFALINRNLDYEKLAAVAIPAVMLTSPVLEAHHPVIMMFSLTYFFANKETLPKWFIITLIVSVIFISIGCVLDNSTYIYNFSLIAGLFIIWIGVMVFTGYTQITEPNYHHLKD